MRLWAKMARSPAHARQKLNMTFTFLLAESVTRHRSKDSDSVPDVYILYWLSPAMGFFSYRTCQNCRARNRAYQQRCGHRETSCAKDILSAFRVGITKMIFMLHMMKPFTLTNMIHS